MSDEMLAIIRVIETERDKFVRRCNAAIEALRGGEDAAAALGKHRFKATVAPRPPRVGAQRGARAGSDVMEGRSPQTRAAGRPPGAGAAKSVKDMIREAVRSQTQPFTLRDVRAYIESRFPGAAAKISGDRYSKELYHLRVTERLFEISSKGEKGGAHVYKLKAA
ncbi:hypothetical protein ESB00_00350 [Oleiharenicola lentus]|uniref:Uncharacterized protein n=1 Tax=Oleiharenicola lentus TaxID=2508720 RepID=A0A4Q1C699_9BACT|nr:hypothetical protein [Oleiharenicola lentus]RXK54383.1 hypothetical protein ESB00_00350 [Oleiharenicola lentus]